MGCLSGFEKLGETKEFQFIYKRGKSVHTRTCVLFYYRKSHTKKVGFTASKKVGNAVKRNRCKRRLRAVFDTPSCSVAEGMYIFVAKVQLNNATFQELEGDLRFLLKKAGCLQSKQ